MSNYTELKNKINSKIRTNGKQEITGAVLNDVLISLAGTVESDSNAINKTMAQLNKNVSDSIDAVNKNVADGFNTINGGINNEIRPSVSANTESIKLLQENLAAVNKNMADGFNTINKNVADSINTINGGIDNEIRPAISANTETISTLDSKVAKNTTDLDYIGNTLIPEMNENTARALETKVGWDEERKVISLPADGSISAMRGEPVEGMQPEGGNLICQRTYDSGATYVTEVGTAKNLLTLNGSERPSVDIPSGQEKMAFMSDMPVVIQFPLRTLSDRVYTQEEILGFFGVSDIPSLKTLFASGPLCYLKYGITLTYNPMYYRFPVHYTAFESADVVVLKFIGLDTSNDEAVKYTITMNLSGELIDGNCNIKIEMKSLEQAS